MVALPSYLQHPLQVLVIVWVDRLNVLERDLHPEHVLVEGAGKMDVQQLAIVQCLGNLAGGEREEGGQT